MTIRAHLDDQFARQFGGLPQIEKPIAPGLVVNEYHMDGLLLGNADFEVNQQEAIFGICAEGDCDDQ